MAEENKNQIVDTDILLIRNFNNFFNKCVSEGMRNIKKISELFRVKEELTLSG